MITECEKIQKKIVENTILEKLSFIDCEFDHCEFSEVKLEGCLFKNCVFRNCTFLNLNFNNTYGSSNDFYNCVMVGIIWDNLMKPESIFQPFDVIEKCTLRYNSFYKMDLRKRNFTGCDLSGSMFERCNLSEAMFAEACLREAVFDDNNLTGTDFRNAKEYIMDVRKNFIKGTKFSMPEAVSLLLAMNIVID